MRSKIINRLIYATVLFLPFYLVRFSVWGIPTNPLEIMILIAFILGLSDFKKSKFIWSLGRIYWLSFGLIFLGLIASASRENFTLPELGIIKGWFVVPFLFFWLILNRIDSPEKIERLLKCLFVSSFGMGLIGLLYLANKSLTFDGRLQALYLSPNHLAMFLVPGIIWGFFSVLQIIQKGQRWGRSFYFLLSGLVVLLVNLYFTFSYGAWLALFLSLLAAGGLTPLLNRSQKINIFLLLLSVGTLFFVFQLANPKLEGLLSADPRSSLTSRMMIWQSAWKIGSDHWLWGIGPGNFQNKYLEYQSHFPPYLEWAVPQPHNLFLAFWLQTGISGLLGFLILLISWIKQILRSLRLNKKDSFVQTALLAMIFYTLIHGLLDTPYWKNDLAIIFWLILALGFSSLGKIQAIKMAVSPIGEK